MVGGIGPTRRPSITDLNAISSITLSHCRFVFNLLLAVDSMAVTGSSIIGSK